jgi:hypothetical protein
MKAGRCILKLIAALAVIGAATYAVVTYWDTIVDLFYVAVSKIKDKKAQFCDCVLCSSEFDDFADEAAE